MKSRPKANINKFLFETKIGVIFQLALIAKEIPDEPLSVLLMIFVILIYSQPFID